MYWLCYYDVLFGANSIILSKPYSISAVGQLAFYLYSLTSVQAAYFFIIPALILTLLRLLWPGLQLITDLCIWFLIVNIHNKIYASLTGGDYLLNQLLFFNCFLSARYRTHATWQSALKIAMHNFAIVAVMVQVSLAYFLSALAKLADTDWLQGNAVSVISQVTHFSMYSFPATTPLPDFFAVAANYLVLLYQLVFPALIWLKPLKKPVLIAGIFMHLYIAFVMGLVGFGVVMIIGYVYFWPVTARSVLNTEKSV